MQTLRTLYYDPSLTSSYGGVDRLYRKARQTNPQITRRFVKTWLSQEVPYTVHKSVRHRFKRNPVYVNNIDDQWQADLADMQTLSRQNRGFRYMLTVIDVFSKFAWVQPLKSKTSAEVIRAFQEIFKRGRKPVAIQTDRGKEFDNRWFRSFLTGQDVKFFTSKNQTIKCSVVERFNRTIKSRIYRYFTAKGTTVWINVIQQLVASYNRSFHRSIRMRPVDVNADNRTQVHSNLYGASFDPALPQLHRRSKVNFGDKVRINKLVHPFRKGYLPNWSEQTYDVAGINQGDQRPLVSVKDASGALYGPRLYPEEIQVVTETPNSTYRIEKILKTKVVNGTTFHRIKWLGFPVSFNTWEPASNVINLSSLNV